MCGHFFSNPVHSVQSAIHDPIGAVTKNLPLVLDAIAIATGNPELIPLAQGVGTAGQGLIKGQGIGESLRNGVTSGLVAYGGGQLMGGLSNAFPETFGDISSGLTSAGKSIGIDNLGAGFAPSGDSSMLGRLISGGGTAQSSGILSNLGLGANAAESAAGNSLTSGTQDFLNSLSGAEQISPALSAADPSLASSAAGGASASSAVSGLLGKAVNNPLTALTMLSGIAQLNSPPKGTQSQQQILDQMNAQQAQQHQQASSVVNQLNNASLNRHFQNPNLSQADYYTYGSRPEQLFYDNQSTPIQFTQTFAKGGYVKGGLPSGGQEDDVDAKLSNGEFVIPADVVSGLGDGANDAGADKLYEMMDNIRKHKTGSTKYPPKAKNPEKYMGKKKYAKGGSIKSMSSAPDRHTRYQVYGRI